MIQLLTAFIHSFYNPVVYRDAIIRWKGFGGRYLVFLSAVLALMLAISFYISLVPFEKNQLPFIAKQIPPMTINDGVVSVTEKQPIVIQSEGKNFTMLIDTSKSAADLRATNSQFAVGKDFALVRGQDNTYQTVDFRKIKGKLLIDEQSLYRYLKMFKIIAVPLLWLGQIINLLIKVLVVTVLSYVVTAFMLEEYDFVTRMRLSILALTPAVIISTATTLILNHEIAPWFFALVACLYIYVMIVMMRKLPPVENIAFSETT